MSFTAGDKRLHMTEANFNLSLDLLLEGNIGDVRAQLLALFNWAIAQLEGEGVDVTQSVRKAAEVRSNSQPPCVALRAPFRGFSKCVLGRNEISIVDRNRFRSGRR